MPKPYFRSCFQCIRSLEHPFPNHTSLRVPRAITRSPDQSIHAQTSIMLVFQQHTYSHQSIYTQTIFHSCSKRAYDHQSIHAQTIIPFVFQEHTVTRPEHPCPNQNCVSVSGAYGHQSIHAQTIILFVFQEHTVTRASMPKPELRECFRSIRSPEHPCPNHNSVRVSRAYGHQSIHAKT